MQFISEAIHNDPRLNAEIVVAEIDRLLQNTPPTGNVLLALRYWPHSELQRLREYITTIFAYDRYYDDLKAQTRRLIELSFVDRTFPIPPLPASSVSLDSHTGRATTERSLHCEESARSLDGDTYEEEMDFGNTDEDEECPPMEICIDKPLSSDRNDLYWWERCSEDSLPVPVKSKEELDRELDNIELWFRLPVSKRAKYLHAPLYEEECWRF
jgi:hypothetical protein